MAHGDNAAGGLAAPPLTPLERFLLGGWRDCIATPPARALLFAIAALLALFLAYKAVNNQVTETNVLTEDRVSLARFLDGTAYRPFAHRALMPVVINTAEHVLRIPRLVDAGPAVLRAKLTGFCARATAQPQADCDSVVTYAVVAGGCFFFFLMVMRAAAIAAFGCPVLGLLAVPFSYLVVNAFLLAGLSHSYDFPVLMVAALLILCLLRGWIWGYVILMPFAFATKETLVLWAGVFFFVQLGHLTLRRNLLVTAVLILSFVVVHGAIAWHFSANAGSGHEYYLPEQIYFFTEHIDLRLLLLMLLALVLVFHGFPAKHEALRRACIVMPPWFLLFIWGGVQREIRVMFEILPLVVLLAADGIARLTGMLPPPPAAPLVAPR